MKKRKLSLTDRKKAKILEYDKVFDGAVEAIDALRTIVGENPKAIQKLRDIDRAMKLLEQHHEVLDDVVDDVLDTHTAIDELDDCTRTIRKLSGDIKDAHDDLVDKCLELLGPDNDA